MAHEVVLQGLWNVGREPGLIGPANRYKAALHSVPSAIVQLTIIQWFILFIGLQAFPAFCAATQPPCACRHHPIEPGQPFPQRRCEFPDVLQKNVCPVSVRFYRCCYTRYPVAVPALLQGSNSATWGGFRGKLALECAEHLENSMKPLLHSAAASRHRSRRFMLGKPVSRGRAPRELERQIPWTPSSARC